MIVLRNNELQKPQSCGGSQNQRGAPFHGLQLVFLLFYKGVFIMCD
jgi:hypothetical protein